MYCERKVIIKVHIAFGFTFDGEKMCLNCFYNFNLKFLAKLAFFNVFVFEIMGNLKPPEMYCAVQ